MRSEVGFDSAVFDGAGFTGAVFAGPVFGGAVFAGPGFDGAALMTGPAPDFGDAEALAPGGAVGGR